MINPDEVGTFWDLTVKKGDQLNGKVTSNYLTNIYFLNEKNLHKFLDEKDFDPLYDRVPVLSTLIDFRSPINGTIFLAIEGQANKKITLEIALTKYSS